MRPWLEPAVGQFSVDLSHDLVVLKVCGDLHRAYLDDFFRRLAFATSGFRFVVLDMASVDSLGQAALDCFVTLSRGMEIRGLCLALTALPAVLFRHQVRTLIADRGEIRFYETVEGAIHAFTWEEREE